MARGKVVDFDPFMRAIDNDVDHEEVRQCGKLLEGHLGHLQDDPVTKSHVLLEDIHGHSSSSPVPHHPPPSSLV